MQGFVRDREHCRERSCKSRSNQRNLCMSSISNLLSSPFITISAQIIKSDNEYRREAPLCNSSQDLFINALREEWRYNALHAGHVMVIQHIMDAKFQFPPFAHSSNHNDEKETFVLRFDDLYFQDMFCDPETGEVTGMIDWERCSTAPCCIGFSSLPLLDFRLVPRLLGVLGYISFFGPWSLIAILNRRR
jgi:hypothetical protein